MERKYNNKLLPQARELRRNLTPEERHLWYDFLQHYPVKFHKQKILGQYIADFYCAKTKLVIELDGNQHGIEDFASYDRIRTDYLRKEFGIIVIRFRNDDINVNFRDVCNYIDKAVKALISRNSDDSQQGSPY
ncbi:MAG: endonuclease domain-containing protein [Oscillospiraceae bacterium]|nr:endonuclease domain-containing protein [Oscillospiraceae bacterium]